MIELIGELKTAGIHVLPMKFKQDGAFWHPFYNDKFQTGFTDDELSALYKDGFNKAIAVIHGPCNPDLVCLDFDEKNAPGKNLFDTWKQLIDQDVLRKLVIEKTRSNGYHVFFLCKDTPPKKALASSFSGEEWIASRSRSNTGITYCAPSKGYVEMQGSLAYDLQYISKDDMFDMCDAAVQLNEYTGEKAAKTSQLPVKKIPSTYAAITSLFDKKVPESWVMDYLAELGWTTDNISRHKNIFGSRWEYVKMWRPGKSQDEDYSANFWIGRKKLSVFTSSTPLPCFDDNVNFSHTPSHLLYYMNQCNWHTTMAIILDLCHKLSIDLPKATPMVYMIPAKDKEIWKVEVKGIIEWAINKGYRWMRITNDDDSILQLVRIVDNVIYDVDDKDLIRQYTAEIERHYPAEAPNRTLTQFIPSVFKYMDALPLFDDDLLHDGRDYSYIYFSNGVLKVTANGTELLDYADLPGCVFARHIKPFEYRDVPDHGPFGEFIGMVSTDDDHAHYIKTALGYIMHHYKLRNYAKALMIIEDVDDQSEARGRSGKGLIAQFVEWIRWTVQQDGRNYKSDSQFKMQRIVPGVQVYYLNDPAPGVLMNQFYNFVTDDWLVEAKGKKAYSIPFKHSPKILITTNYLPNLESDSDIDRFIIMPIKKVFGAEMTVRDAFPGVIFFDDDWEAGARMGAIRFAVDCLQLYFRHGVARYENEKMKQNANRRLIQTLVPDCIIETMEQAMEAARNSKGSEEFKTALRVYDLRKDQSENMTKAFAWEPGKLIVFVNQFYQYCLKAYQLKSMGDKTFSKRLRTYIEKGGFVKLQELRNNISGVRILVQIPETQNLHCDENLHEFTPYIKEDDDMF